MEALDKMVPFRVVGMSWAPLLFIYFLPNSWWGIILKIVAGIILLVVWVSTFSPMWNAYQTLGAFTVLNTVYLAGILWLGSVSWLIYVFSLLIVLAFMTKLKFINDYNRNLIAAEGK